MSLDEIRVVQNVVYCIFGFYFNSPVANIIPASNILKRKYLFANTVFIFSGSKISVKNGQNVGKSARKHRNF